MDLTVTLHDQDGNEIIPGKCKCGKAGDTCIMGKEAFMWMCNECLYPPSPVEAKFVYVEYGGGWPEGFQKKMEERMEKAKSVVGFNEVKPKRCVEPSLRGTPEFDAQIKEWTKDMYKDKEGNRLSIEQLCQLMENDEYKIVAQEFVCEFWISTVWLGVKHFNDAFFESMIFTGVEKDLKGDWKEHACFRYKTLKEASDGHTRIIELMRTACDNYPGQTEKVIEAIEDYPN